LNKVILIGRLVADPELRYTANGTPVASFRLAVDRRTTGPDGKREADFIDIVVFRRLAEICAQYLNKGRPVAVDGRLQVRSYTTNDGQKRKTYEVVANDMQMLGPGGGKAPAPSAEAGGEEHAAGRPDLLAEDAFDSLGVDDIPF